MGVQFNGRGKIKSYNHNGRCVLLDEPCFKRGVDCTPCTRIHKSKSKPESVMLKHETILQPETKPIFESVAILVPEHETEPTFELVPETVPDIIFGIKPKSIVEPQLIPTPIKVHGEPPDKIIIDEPILVCKKKWRWSNFTDFIGSIKSIFKRNNRKPPKTPRKNTGDIYVWKIYKEGFGKKKVGKL